MGIDLRTGIPGSGKTLSAVEALAKMIGRWDKHPEEARPVFVHGVKDLALPHAKVPLIDVMVGKLKTEVPDWASMPDGSYVLVDECQSIFPPRASGSVMPDHVAFLNTHRHRGFDITLITQHPRLIDTAARALVGKHQHFRRLFGRQRAVCYEWDSCSDNLGGLNNAVTSYYPYPAKAFQWYKSAEIHTKQNFKLPRWLIIPFVGVALGIFAFPAAYSRVMSLTQGDKTKTTVVVTQGVPPAMPASSPGGVGAGGPVAPVVVAPVPTFAGCMKMRDRCECLGVDGRLVEVTPARCSENVGQSGRDVPYLTANSRQVDAAMSRLAGPTPVPVVPLVPAVQK